MSEERIDTKICPCGSGHNFAACCGLYIYGVKAPDVPEQLMRSRYTAFHSGFCHYLLETSSKSLKTELSLDELQTSIEHCQFIKLEVTRVLDNSVEFKAHLIVNHEYQVMHEHSSFVMEDGKWKYDKGELYPTSSTNLTRNEACPCGSGKKYKKCHLLKR